MARGLTRWDPWSEAVSLQEAMDRLFEESFIHPRRSWPAPSKGEALAVDMYETDDEVVVKTGIPGVKAEDIDISVTDDLLTIQGETEAEDKLEEANYVRQERHYGAFARHLSLPSTVVAERATAEFEDGVLTLTLPKAEEAKPKTIKIKAEGR